MNVLNSKKVMNVFLFLICTYGFSQEIIKEKEPEKKSVQQQTKRQKIDGIIATVGDYIILDSDIDKAFLEIEGSGGSVKDITRCQMIGKLLEDKLYCR